MTALIAAFEGESAMDLLIALVVSMRMCIDYATKLPDTLTEAPFGDGVGRVHLAGSTRYVELLTPAEIHSVVQCLAGQSQDSIQRRGKRAAIRKVHEEDYDEEELEEEGMKDAQEDEICYHVWSSP
jgi:hypothetical protein